MRARAAVFAGELAVAEEAIGAADAAFAADMLRGARTLPYIELSRLWLLAAEGSRGPAAERALTLATALEHTAKPIAVEVTHAAVRLGRAADARELAERLAVAVDGPYAALVAAHARALADGEPDALAAVGDGFEALGADLVAAEALRSATNAYRRAGRGMSASTADRRVERLLARCASPSSPGLEPLALVVTLSHVSDGTQTC